LEQNKEMTEPTYISDEMRSIIGKTYEESESYPIAANDIRRWAIATYYPSLPPELYVDEDYAKTTVFGGMVAPEDFNPFAWATAKPGLKPHHTEFNVNFIEASFGIQEPPTKHSVNGGSQTKYFVRMRPGDVIRSSMTVSGYTERDGRVGRMLLTHLRETWVNQNDETVKTADHTMIRY
jgi:hypothetical protein